jgi:hypothetical protein
METALALADPAQAFVMFPNIWDWKVLQRPLTSAGLVCALLRVSIRSGGIRFPVIAYSRAAIKHAGGVAMANRAKTTNAARRKLIEVYIVTVFVVLLRSKGK